MTIIDCYNNWFSKNGRMTSEAPSVSVVCDGTKFFFYACMEDAGNGYRGILGYSIVENRLACRMWYYSGSEASWRAFTGQRNDLSWMKGYEGDPDPAKRSMTSLGYVFECFVTVGMSVALEAFWSKIEKDAGIMRENHCCPPKFEMSPNLSAYFRGGRAKISSDYGNERQFESAGLPLQDAHLEGVISKTSSVKIQNKFIIGHQHNIGAKIRTNTDMDAWLTACLKSEKGIRAGNYHPTLKESYDIFEYSLIDRAGKTLTLEIAATKNYISHKYTGPDGSQLHLDTNICWVRDVFYNDTGITSYGTRKRIPINLSFLVQKPIDYFSQVSEDYVLAIAPDGEIPSVVKYQLERNKISGMFVGKGGYSNKYLILSFLNESTSTLVYEFKTKKQHPRFDTTYKKPVGPSLNTGFNHSEDALAIMQQKIITGINEYNCLRLDSGVYTAGGIHGDAGLKRANALRTAILECDDQLRLNNVIYDCFVENIIRSGNRVAFKGGIFSKIQTNQTSLFTCICRALLSDSVMPKGRDGRFHLTAPISLSNLKGQDKCISRIKAFIYNQSGSRDAAQSNALFITAKSQELLDALRG